MPPYTSAVALAEPLVAFATALAAIGMLPLLVISAEAVPAVARTPSVVAILAFWLIAAPPSVVPIVAFALALPPVAFALASTSMVP